MRMRHRQSGVSLLEAVITTGIIAVLIPAITYVFLLAYRSYRDLSASDTGLQEVRATLERIARDIRQSRVSESGSYPIVTAAAQEFLFYANIDTDALTERVRYRLTATTLQRGITNPTGASNQYLDANEVFTTASLNIVNGGTAIFQYYDNNYTGTQAALTTPININAVRFVTITLLYDANPNQLPPAQQLTTGAHLRNLKDNY